MKRLALLTLLILVAAPAAGAKEVGFVVCGASGCVTPPGVTTPPLRESSADAAWAPGIAAPFFRLRYGTTRADWLPSKSLLRLRPNGGAETWTIVLASEEAFLRVQTGRMRPYPAPVVTEASVDYDVVKRPRGYIRLLTLGTPAVAPPGVEWVAVTLTSRSIWFDGVEMLWVSRKGYVLRNRTVFAISPALASRVLRRLPLG